MWTECRRPCYLTLEKLRGSASLDYFRCLVLRISLTTRALHVVATSQASIPTLHLPPPFGSYASPLYLPPAPQRLQCVEWSFTYFHLAALVPESKIHCHTGWTGEAGARRKSEASGSCVVTPNGTVWPACFPSLSFLNRYSLIARVSPTASRDAKGFGTKRMNVMGVGWEVGLLPFTGPFLLDDGNTCCCASFRS